jgi:capsular polysaccharide biosynthesis protein
MLRHLPSFNEPPDIPWDASSYQSITPWVCEFRDVVVHTSAGIIRTDDAIVAETLTHTMPNTHRYSVEEDFVRLLAPSPKQLPRFAGCWLSLLGPMEENYYHWTIDILGRLSAADAAALDACEGVLIPPLRHGFQEESLSRSGLPDTHKIRQFGMMETVRIDRLIVPWTMAGHHRPHPALADFGSHLGTSSCSAPPPHLFLEWPKRLYVDRRASSHRPLLNESDVIASLMPLGFVSVRLEELQLQDQQNLFAHAEIIVAPHGAGLTNLLYARPGAQVIELIMDGWACWCFRHLAAIRGLRYDCVIGRQVNHDVSVWVHARAWKISTFHVTAAVAMALDMRS